MTLNFKQVLLTTTSSSSSNPASPSSTVVPNPRSNPDVPVLAGNTVLYKGWVMPVDAFVGEHITKLDCPKCAAPKSLKARGTGGKAGKAQWGCTTCDQSGMIFHLVHSCIEMLGQPSTLQTVATVHEVMESLELDIARKEAAIMSSLVDEVTDPDTSSVSPMIPDTKDITSDEAVTLSSLTNEPPVPVASPPLAAAIPILMDLNGPKSPALVEFLTDRDREMVGLPSLAAARSSDAAASESAANACAVTVTGLSKLRHASLRAALRIKCGLPMESVITFLSTPIGTSVVCRRGFAPMVASALVHLGGRVSRFDPVRGLSVDDTEARKQLDKRSTLAILKQWSSKFSSAIAYRDDATFSEECRLAAQSLAEASIPACGPLFAGEWEANLLFSRPSIDVTKETPPPAFSFSSSSNQFSILTTRDDGMLEVAEIPPPPVAVTVSSVPRSVRKPSLNQRNAAYLATAVPAVPGSSSHISQALRKQSTAPKTGRIVKTLAAPPAPYPPRPKPGAVSIESVFAAVASASVQGSLPPSGKTDGHGDPLSTLGPSGGFQSDRGGSSVPEADQSAMN